MGKGCRDMQDTSGVHVWLVLGKAFRALAAHAGESLNESRTGLGDSDFRMGAGSPIHPPRSGRERHQLCRHRRRGPAILHRGTLRQTSGMEEDRARFPLRGAAHGTSQAFG